MNETTTGILDLDEVVEILPEVEVALGQKTYDTFKASAEAVVDARGYVDAILARGAKASRDDLIQALKEVRAAINW